MNHQLVLFSCLSLFTTPLFAQDRVMPIEPPMVAIPGGDFMMGHLRAAKSQPVRAVAIKPFRMGKYEVTAEEFGRFVQATRYAAPRMCSQFASRRGFEDVPNDYVPAGSLLSTSKFEPATCIDWTAADAYVKWLAKETGRKYRLPTEAEWEYAHRAGSSSRYFWGNDELVACRYANLADRSAEAAVQRDFGIKARNYVGVMPCDDKAEYASIVGLYEPNAFGLHDTLGNVAEFVQDCWRKNYEGASRDGTPPANGDCSKRAVRGGSWHWRGFHATHRSEAVASRVAVLSGFRLAEDGGPLPATASTASAFEQELAAAQQAERARRSAVAELTRPAN